MTGELLYSETTLLGRASPRHTRHGPHWTGCFTSRRPKRGCNACVSARTLNDVQQPVKPHAHLAPKSDVYLLRSDGLSCSREIVEANGSLSFACTSSQQHLLVWKQRPKCVMVLKKIGEELEEEFAAVVDFLGREQGLLVVVEDSCHECLVRQGLGKWILPFHPSEAFGLHRAVDFIVSLGGDGLILHAAHLFGTTIPPIISFKLGSLGFLTCHDHRDYRRHLHDVIHGCTELTECGPIKNSSGVALQGIPITLRMRLTCSVDRADVGEGPPPSEDCVEVLNEVVLSRGANPYLCNIEVYERDNYITQVQADGILVATPTGSTAYSVAAGGSMVHPNTPAILFTPICPHSLSFRPVILPDYAVLRLRVSPDARCAAQVSFDGKRGTELAPGDSLRVCMSPNPVPTINHADQTTDWFGSIERCFHWNDRLSQKGLAQAQPPTRP
ncbi:NADK1 [Auxenochlorella protothecoides x Auxenochlorella symbiontica]|uniref:NAD kinase 2, chloroplastic n=3 Tax=Auxenochlorella protothecoides TaxID=3075 RepID=A0A1D2A0W9_AUXPR